jgi:hypothetical protein
MKKAMTALDLMGLMLANEKQADTWMSSLEMHLGKGKHLAFNDKSFTGQETKEMENKKGTYLKVKE